MFVVVATGAPEGGKEGGGGKKKGPEKQVQTRPVILTDPTYILKGFLKTVF